MKKIKDYITEKLKISNETHFHRYFPKSKSKLKEIIDNLIEERGNECDLNDIDVSNVTSMSELFRNSKFNGDISKWDVHKVYDMSGMFFDSKFNGDISKWDVSNVKNMTWMFRNTMFNKDISKWKVDKKCVTKDMFSHCPLENNPPVWYEETK